MERYIELLVCRQVVAETRKKLVHSMQVEREAIIGKEVLLHSGRMTSLKTEFSVIEKL